MKKLMALFLALMMCMSLCACGGHNESKSSIQSSVQSSSQSSSQSQVVKEDLGPTDMELARAVKLIKKAEDNIIAIVNQQIDKWSSTAMYYFRDCDSSFAAELYGESSSIYLDIQKHRELGDKASENLKEAKKLIGTKGTGDYYNAVKEYYKTVSAFLELASKEPDGYIKLTFMTAVTEYTEKCNEAYLETDFYN